MSVLGDISPKKNGFLEEGSPPSEADKSPFPKHTICNESVWKGPFFKGARIG